jgi:hypothetical protein
MLLLENDNGVTVSCCNKTFFHTKVFTGKKFPNLLMEERHTNKNRACYLMMDVD